MSGAYQETDFDGMPWHDCAAWVFASWPAIPTKGSCLNFADGPPGRRFQSLTPQWLRRIRAVGGRPGTRSRTDARRPRGTRQSRHWRATDQGPHGSTTQTPRWTAVAFSLNKRAPGPYNAQRENPGGRRGLRASARGGTVAEGTETQRSDRRCSHGAHGIAALKTRGGDELDSLALFPKRSAIGLCGADPRSPTAQKSPTL